MTAIAIFLTFKTRPFPEAHLRAERARKRAELETLLADISAPADR